MARYSETGRVKVSTKLPPLNQLKIPLETEVKYRGLVRDLALSDIEDPSQALSEVLLDIQDPAEQQTEGKFLFPDLEVLDGIINYGLKNEDLAILENSSLNLETESGNLTPLVNPRQRITDRIKQLEFFAGRGTVFQGQGTSMFKYVVPLDETDNGTETGKLYSHTNPPPFYTHDLEDDENDSTTPVENGPDFIPTSPTQIENSHRVGYIKDGKFVPDIEKEWWWAGAYKRDYRGRDEYSGTDAFTNPSFPVVRDGNISFSYSLPRAVPNPYNWGLKMDFWMKRASSDDVFGKFLLQVSGHIRIDYFEATGYNSTTGAIEGSWKTAIDTTDPNTYYSQPTKEGSSDDALGYRTYYIQGGPSNETLAQETTTSTPTTQRTAANGASWDYANTTFDDLEGVNRRFFNQYVPVVIRYWFGQEDPADYDALVADKGEANITIQDLAKLSPGLTPGFEIDFILAEEENAKWNDYKAIVKIQTSNNGETWQALDSVDLKANFNEIVEVLAYSTVTSPDLTNIYGDDWISSQGYLNGRVDQTTGDLTIGDLGITTGPIYVVLTNRVVNAAPVSYSSDELWQRYIFHPNLQGTYNNRNDMLEGVGTNYSEPDPKKVQFENNYEAYKIIYGELPPVNVYDKSRYDGALDNSLTTQSSDRDYDYSHNKLLFIGRQKKDETVKPLQTDEVRTDGDNYTFFTITENAAGLGGSVLIYGTPANNYGVITSSATTGTVGKALHMADNVSTFDDDTIQLYSTSADYVAANSNAAQGFSVQFKYVNGTISGNKHLIPSDPGTNKIIADSDFGSGTSAPDVDNNEMFLPGLIKGGTEYYFYDLIGVARPAEEVELTISSDGNPAVVSITDSTFFGGIVGNNNDYLGTRIEIAGTAYYVTAYDYASKKVTIDYGATDPTTLAGNKQCKIFYNFLSFSNLPSVVINSSQEEISNPITNTNLVDLIYVYSSGYQFRKIDSGVGLGIADSLYLKGNAAASQLNPFADGSEIPAPPAQIVTPFGYDKSVSASDPGLGGICYPPYGTQDIQLLPVVKSTSDINSAAEGQFDVYWGSTDSSKIDNLDGKYLQVNKKLIFDFDTDEINNILVTLPIKDKPDFTVSSTTYNAKLLVEIPAVIPQDADNNYLYKDALTYTDNQPAKSNIFLFLDKGTSNISLLTKNRPTWT